MNLPLPKVLQRRANGASGPAPNQVNCEAYKSGVCGSGPGALSADGSDAMLSAPQFRRMLAVEQKRCVRSGRRIVLMLLDWGTLLSGVANAELSGKVLRTLAGSIRDTDIRGWYDEQSVFGVIFTELGDADSQAIANALLTRVTQALAGTLGIDKIHKIGLAFHIFPEEANPDNGGSSSGSGSLPGKHPFSVPKAVKRAIDINGSLCLILFFAPLLLLIALAVKLTSSGPVLFCQTRIGRNGRPFTFLKFRSMRNGNDPWIHQEFVTKLIKGELDSGTKEFKIKSDPRVTSIGRLLRKSSLDELPQLFNVLMGDMSLVGPRPPVRYEFECYKTWHRRRLSDIRPGITGLWQVKGRSRVGFDDMVRLDLQYARTWSLWLDLMILLATPRAVVSGNGAH